MDILTEMKQWDVKEMAAYHELMNKILTNNGKKALCQNYSKNKN